MSLGTFSVGFLHVVSLGLFVGFCWFLVVFGFCWFYDYVLYDSIVSLVEVETKCLDVSGTSTNIPSPPNTSFSESDRQSPTRNTQLKTGEIKHKAHRGLKNELEIGNMKTNFSISFVTLDFHPLSFASLLRVPTGGRTRTFLLGLQP